MVFQKALYNNIPNVTIWRVLRKRLHVKTYKVSIVQGVEHPVQVIYSGDFHVTFDTSSFSCTYFTNGIFTAPLKKPKILALPYYVLETTVTRRRNVAVEYVLLLLESVALCLVQSWNRGVSSFCVLRLIASPQVRFLIPSRYFCCSSSQEHGKKDEREVKVKSIFSLVLLRLLSHPVP
jgi:hypothetical protein